MLHRSEHKDPRMQCNPLHFRYCHQQQFNGQQTRFVIPLQSRITVKKKPGLAHNIFGAEYCKTHTFEKAHFTPLQSRITFAVPSTVKHMVLRTPSSFAHNTYCILGVWQVGP